MGPRDAACDMRSCGQPAAGQAFALHGIQYKISLCGFHARMLDQVLEPFRRCAREVAPAPIAVTTPAKPAGPCEGFQWAGQSFASCERCARPYWDHTHVEVIRRDASPFDENPMELRPITPESATACKAKWGDARAR